MTVNELLMTKWIFAGAFAATLAATACNDVGTCPSADSIQPGGSCSGESLECAYTLQTASPACDGTMLEGGLGTSCVCTKGAWACPSAVACPAAEAGGDDGGGTQDAVVGDDGGPGSDGPGIDGG